MEVKYKSGKRGTGEDDQLARYNQAVSGNLKNFTCAEVSSFSGFIGPIVYVTEYEASLDIENSRRELGSQPVQPMFL